MRTRFTRLHRLAGNLFALTALLLSPACRAEDVVAPGWDLFMTLNPPTSLAGVPLNGVPLESFDFGGTLGVQDVGLTDTIMQRLGPANAPSTTIPVELVALQLVSAAPVDLGAGLGFHYLTLQSARGGPASVGIRTINFGPEGVPHGTFDSLFDVFIDIRLGALDGPILLSTNLPVSASGVPWSHQGEGSLRVPGVNYLLKGDGTTGQDFFPVGPFVEQAPIGVHGLISTPVPEPGALALAASSLVIGLSLLRRRRK